MQAFTADIFHVLIEGLTDDPACNCADILPNPGLFHSARLALSQVEGFEKNLRDPPCSTGVGRKLDRHHNLMI